MTTIVSVIANTDQVVHAPTPALGSPNMPAPTQTLAMMQVPPINEGLFSIILSLSSFNLSDDI
jgi:hypothetical protein